MAVDDQRFIESLRRSQWLSPERLAKYQRPLIEKMARHAAGYTAFYADRLKPLFANEDSANAEIDWSRWADVPIVTRVEATERWEDMQARQVPSDSGPYRVGNSSGSTGRQFKHLRSDIADIAAACLVERIYEIFNMNLSGSFAYITVDLERRFSYPAGSVMQGWNRTVPSAPLYLLDIGCSAGDQLEWLERMRPDFVMTYPINLREVAERALAQSSRLTFKNFVSTGEMLDSETRAIIEKAFRCSVIDLYAAREVGPIAFRCPTGQCFHVCAENLYCELLDERGRPVGPGEFGRVVVTSLYNFAMPFIRYDVGDYAMPSADLCSCGRGLPAIQQIGGRSRSRFIMPDGSPRRMRFAVMHEIHKYLSYRTLQFVQTGFNTLEIRYVSDDKGAQPDVAGLSKLFKNEFHSALEVRPIAVDRIERGPGMKVEQFITLVEC